MIRDMKVAPSDIPGWIKAASVEWGRNKDSSPRFRCHDKFDSLPCVRIMFKIACRGAFLTSLSTILPAALIDGSRF
jgi:hypothetical protein